MAVDVSSLVRLLARYGREDGGGDGGGDGERKHRSELVTRDLLGGCCVVGGAVGGVAPVIGPQKELYPDLNEIMLRDVGLQQHRAAAFGSMSRSSRQIQDLNMPPLWHSGVPPPVRRSAVDVRPAVALDLKLLHPLAARPPAEYQSVCTLEKVKSALERAERESRWKQQQQPRDPPPLPRCAPAVSGSPASSSTTTSSAKRRLERVGPEEEGEGESRSPSGPEAASSEAEDGAAAGAEMAAAGCPICLMYVLISRSNPRCPRCSSAVPLPPPLPRAATKKARFDLNAATASSARPATVVNSPVRTVKFF